MKLKWKKNILKTVAMMLIAVSLFECVNIGNLTAYAQGVNDGMIYSPDKQYVETKLTPNPNGIKANGLVHGKTLYIIGQTTGTDGQLWYQVQYYTGTSGTTLNTAYCPADRVQLNKDMVATSTAKANADMTLWSCTKSYQNPALASIPAGTKLYITESKNDSGLWYRVYCDLAEGRRYGWVEAESITVDEVPDLPTDTSYEDQLRQAGFPESYIKPLAILHEQYPNWVFVPKAINLDWNTVIEKESTGDKNLVSSTADDAKKSIDVGNYDWKTNKYTPKDSGSWVSASSAYIAYCMDPRNFLDAKNIFMFERLNSGVALDPAGVETIIKGTFMEKSITDTDGKTLNYADAFVAVGIEKDVNAYHLATRVRQEQGTAGTSSLISGKYKGYEGYFNYFNIGASGKNQTEVLKKGIETAVKNEWNTRLKSLQGGAAFLKDKYINVGQNTLYFQKFNVVYTGNNQLYLHQYMQNVDAARSEGITMEKAHVDKSKALVFDIPVYLNMPEEAVQFTAFGNPNNYLSGLTVSGVSLSPSFDGAKTEYTAFVDGSVNSISVSADKVASTSKVSGVGTYNLVTGNNVISVKCTAQNGDVKEYIITIVKEAVSEEPVVTIVKGDISGDGVVTIADLVRLNRHILGISVLSGEQLVAADVNGNGEVNIQDLVLINRHILGISTIN